MLSSFFVSVGSGFFGGIEGSKEQRWKSKDENLYKWTRCKQEDEQDLYFEYDMKNGELLEHS